MCMIIMKNIILDSFKGSMSEKITTTNESLANIKK